MDAIFPSHPRILIGKAGLDGHDRGAKYVAHILRDAGFEVIYSGIRRTPEELVAVAIQEDVQAIGISMLSGAHLSLIAQLMDLLRVHEADDIKVFLGGVIPEADFRQLHEMGVMYVFGPGTQADEIVRALRSALNDDAEGD